MKKKQTKWMLMSALLAALLASGPHPAWAGAVQASAAAVEPLTAKIIEARAKLQEGWDSWNVETMRIGRDMFLKLILEQKAENADLYYYAALSDCRLTVYSFTTGQTEEAAPDMAEARKYLEKAIELDPGRGELYALDAAVLGYQIALDPQKGMELGMQIISSFAQAESKEPDNPRVCLLKGQSLLYWPVEYGGGPDKAIAMLDRAVSLFDKEKVLDQVKPSWGKEEAYAFLGLAYVRKGVKDRAADYLKKALEIVPGYRLAQEELKKLQAEK